MNWQNAVLSVSNSYCFRYFIQNINNTILCFSHSPQNNKIKPIFYLYHRIYIHKFHINMYVWYKICSSVVKNLPANAGDDTGDACSIPGLGRSPRVGNGNPLQYSRLGNAMDRGDWRAAVLGVAKCWTWQSDWAGTQRYLMDKHMYVCACVYIYAFYLYITFLFFKYISVNTMPI